MKLSKYYRSIRAIIGRKFANDDWGNKKLNAYRSFFGRLANDIVRLLPEYSTFEVTGPCGLDSKYGVHFELPDGTEKWLQIYWTRNAQDKIELRVVDFQINTDEYPPNSIGWLNGFNHPSIKVPENANAYWFLMWLNYQNS